MCDKKCEAFHVIDHVLQCRVGDGDAIVRGCAAAELIEDDEGSARGAAENVGGFLHLGHEGARATCNVVRGAHTE